MNKEQIKDLISKELLMQVDYNFLVIDMRNKKPLVFKAWRVKE